MKKEHEPPSITIISEIAKYCNEKEIVFDFSDRQRIICYLNQVIDDTTIRLEVAKDFFAHTEVPLEKVLEYFSLTMEVTNYKFFYILKQNGVDVNDFGIPMKFEFSSSKAPKSEIFNAALPSEVLIEKYADYKVEFIWEPLIFKHGVNILGAERGSGKTRMAISLAYSIVFELNDFLKYPIKVWGDVLYLNFEIHEPEFKLFLYPIVKYFEGKGKTQKHELRIISFLSHPDIKIFEIEELIQEFKPVLIIVDSFKAFASRVLNEQHKNELTNLNSDQIYKYYNSWRKTVKTSVLLLNHTNKNTKSQKSHSDLMFGPSALLDYSDHTFLLRKTDVPNQRLILPDKSRFAAEGIAVNNLIEIISEEFPENKLWFEVISVDVREEDYCYTGKEQKYSDEQRGNVQNLYTSGLSIRDISSQTGIPKSTVGIWVKNNKSPP